MLSNTNVVEVDPDTLPSVALAAFQPPVTTNVSFRVAGKKDLFLYFAVVTLVALWCHWAPSRGG